MKWTFTLFFFTILSWNIAYAQCTPDTKYEDSEMGAYPTTLEDAKVANDYEQVITIKIDESTSGVTIDRAELTSIEGLPDDFTYECSAADCSFSPGLHCLVIKGNPTKEQVGTYNLVFNIDAYVVGNPSAIPFEYDGYTLEVVEPDGIEDANILTFNVSQNQPNPFTEATQITVSSSQAKALQFSVINLLGKVVYEDNFKVGVGEFKYNFRSENLDKGVYLYRISDNKNGVTKRMILN